MSGTAGQQTAADLVSVAASLSQRLFLNTERPFFSQREREKETYAHT